MEHTSRIVRSVCVNVIVYCEHDMCEAAFEARCQDFLEQLRDVIGRIVISTTPKCAEYNAIMAYTKIRSKHSWELIPLSIAMFNIAAILALKCCTIWPVILNSPVESCSIGGSL